MFYGNKLCELREDEFLKKKDLAKLLNVHPNLYGQYEMEHALIPTKHLNTLVNYFDVSFDYIFNFTSTEQYRNSSKDIDKIKAGIRLKEFRKEFKLSQDALAKSMNTVHTVIYNYERGRYLIATPFLYTICKKYNISADWLLGKINKPKKRDNL